MNVVTIKREEDFLSSYADSGKTTGIPEPVVFLAGILLWMVLPKLVYAEYGGPVSLKVFAVLALAAVIFGVRNYLNSPPSPPSIIGLRPIQQFPDTLQPTQKKAA
jgi:hypothetical protein